MKTLHLNILSPDGEVFNGEVENVKLPGSLGAFTILPQHAPIVSSLVAGKMAYLVAGEEHVQDIRGGFVEMNGNEVSVCIE